MEGTLVITLGGGKQLFLNTLTHLDVIVTFFTFVRLLSTQKLHLNYFLLVRLEN